MDVTTFAQVNREKMYTKILSKNTLQAIMERIDDMTKDGLPASLTTALVICEEIKQTIYGEYIQEFLGEKLEGK